MRRQATLNGFPCLLNCAHALTGYSDWLYLFTQLWACADRLLWLAFLVYSTVRMRRQATLIGFTCLLNCAHSQTGYSDWLYLFTQLCACADRLLWLALLVYSTVRMRRQASLIGFTCLLNCAHAQAGSSDWISPAGRSGTAQHAWNQVSLTQHLEPVSLQLMSRRAGTASSWCGSDIVYRVLKRLHDLKNF
jgi:hypothetical protein